MDRCVRSGRFAHWSARRKERRGWNGSGSGAMLRWRCLRRGKGGNGIEWLVVDADKAFCDTVTVRCSHCKEVVWRATSSSLRNVLRGKRRLRFEKTEESRESIQVFAMGETRRRVSFDERGRKERRWVVGRVGE